MNLNPKVSILVPIYGVEKFIERCATSLFEQTFQDIEFIFVNDCTPDNSIEILKNTLERYLHRKSQVQIINHEVNKGLAGARNTGVERASGDYILHVDSDDYLELNAIELLYNKALEENADIVTCNFLLEWETEQKVAVQNIGEDKVHFIQLMLSAETMVGLVNKMIKRSLYIDNEIKAIEGVNLGEDFVTTPRLVYFSNKVTKVNEPLYHYVQTNTNSYTKSLSGKSINNVIFVLEELTRFFENTPEKFAYSSALLQGKLKKKIELILSSEDKYIEKLLNIFPETKELKDFSFLSKHEKIVFNLINYKSVFLLKTHKHFYKMMFNGVQKLKGR